ncbi:SdiA-regulated domain-containing protein [Arcobacter sp. LA11]|uniref:SdiA-regulated domain-containing protein n=1 Tax=Arcobacter sp. LA11 TaxID=1898176 RepID=UPI0015757B95|nr:SdiA-regulated domain-containing protein [Arcobacter sp. LA11]
MIEQSRVLLSSKKILLGILIIMSVQNLFAKEKVIAKIPEASGISYSTKSNSLFVVNDEGSLYELSKKGKILREKKIGKYDFEGIVVDDKNNVLLLAIEGKENILILSKDDFKKINEISVKRTYEGVKVLKKGSDGIEGIALKNNKIYLSNQSNKLYPKNDSSVIVIINYDLKKKKQKIENIINHGLTDISGLTFIGDILYMISDNNNFIVSYDINKKKILKKDKLPKKFAQEGIAFDKKGNLYIADDKGQILKIKKYLEE